MKWVSHCLVRPRKRTLLVLLLFVVGGSIMNIAVAWTSSWFAWRAASSPGRVGFPVFDVNFKTIYVTSHAMWNVGSVRQVGGEVLNAQLRIKQSQAIHVQTVPGDEFVFLGKKRDGQWYFDLSIPYMTESSVDDSVLPTWSLVRRSSFPESVNRSIGGDFVASYTGQYLLEEQARGWPLAALHGAMFQNADQTKTPMSWAVWRPSSNSGAPFPYRPLWPGFAINTIFYAAILWLFFTAPGFVRRRIRLMRHHCPACGYQIALGTGPKCSECGTLLRIQNS